MADPERPAPKLDPRALTIQLLDLVRTLARSGPGDAATVVLIEDLHWIDAASEEFVDALADAIVGTTTLLVVNFRPGFVASFMQRSHYRHIVIPPLASEEAHRLLREHFGQDPSLALLSRNMIERAQGNPFFLEELANAMAERGDFEGERGAYRLKHGIDAIPLPATVQAVVAARIDHLEEVAKQVLETAAVIGRLVAMSILKPVAALPNDELLEAISQLRHAELLYDLPPYDQGLLAFRHPLIQEVAYAMQLRSRLVVLHAAIAKAIECFDWGKLDEFAGLLAYHYEAAGHTLEAVTHLQRAAQWIGKTNSAEALKSWKKIRALLQDQPQSEHNDRLRAFSSGQILNFGWREGMSAEEVKPYAEEALKYARAADRMNEPILLGAYGRILAATAAADDYVHLVQDAGKLTSGEGDVGRFATVNAMLSQAFFMSGRLNEALNAGEVALATITEQGGFDSNVTLGLNPNRGSRSNTGSSASEPGSWSGSADFARPSNGLPKYCRLSRSAWPPWCSSFPILRRWRWLGEWAIQSWRGRTPQRWPSWPSNLERRICASRRSPAPDLQTLPRANSPRVRISFGKRLILPAARGPGWSSRLACWPILPTLCIAPAISVPLWRRPTRPLPSPGGEPIELPSFMGLCCAASFWSLPAMLNMSRRLASLSSMPRSC